MTQASGGFSDHDRALLRDELRALLQQQWPAERAVASAGDRERMAAVWSELAALGATALGDSPDSGGWQALLIAIEELGRASCAAPLMEAALCRRLAARAQAEAMSALQSLLAGIDAGTIRPAFVFGQLGGDRGAGVFRADRANRLSGSGFFVDGALTATHYIVAVASDARHDTLMVIAADAGGIAVTPQPGLAQPPLCELQLAQIPGSPVRVVAGGIAELAALARLGLVARACGAARRAFELALDHAKTRRQFGQVIGKFQALQHKLADGYIALEATALLLTAAAQRVDAGDVRWQVAVAASVAYAAPALQQLELQVQHTLAAIGFAEEHEAPRHFRRVYADMSRLGGARAARAALADFLLQPGGARLPDLDLGARANALRHEVREWLGLHWGEAARARERCRAFHERGVDPDFSAQLARKGWIAASWPAEYGGRDYSPLEQYVLAEEVALAGAPTGAHTVGAEIIGPALIRFGTAAQKAQFLPAFARGELLFSLGYSEAEAGSDLASLRTCAVFKDGHWLISGEKLWTTRGDIAAYHWLAARTDPDASPRHAGITIFMVPLNSPGITIRNSMAMYGHSFSAVRYENVRLPDSARVGAVNDGWKIITHALASERNVMGAHVASVRVLFEDLVHHAVSTRQDGRLLCEDPLLRDRLGGLAAEIEAARALSVHAVRIAEQGGTPVHQAAMSKVYVGELLQRVVLAAMDLLGPATTLGEDSAGATIDGRVEQQLRRSIMLVVGGGSAEIQRNLIAARALDLPR